MNLIRSKREGTPSGSLSLPTPLLILHHMSTSRCYASIALIKTTLQLSQSVLIVTVRWNQSFTPQNTGLICVL